MLNSLLNNGNLLTHGYEVEFAYVNNEFWTEGGGKQVPMFTSKKIENSNLFIENLDTVSVSNSAITLDIQFRFNVDLFDTNDNYFGTLSNCEFNTTFKL